MKFSLPKKDQFIIALLGFSCGIPLPLVLSTLKAFLFDYGLSLTSIGAFGSVQLPYSLKPLWSPFLDNLKPPLPSFLGRRRGWLIITQGLLFFLIIAFSYLNPKENIMLILLTTFSLAFVSASQDIIVDAFRVETFTSEDQGTAVAWYTLGYRVALFVAGAGALYLAHTKGWPFAFRALAVFPLLGILTALMSSEPKTVTHKALNLKEWVDNAFVQPFATFMRHKNWAYVLLFVALYKLSDAYLGSMSIPFVLSLGFSKFEVASIIKTYGLFATLAGSFVGGYAAKHFKIYPLLICAGILSSLTNLLFIAQYKAGYSIHMLILTVSIDNFTEGMSAAVFITYLGLLCDKRFVLTQFALLTSLSSIGRAVLSTTSGLVVDKVGWVDFFIFSAILSLPALALVQRINYTGGGVWNFDLKGSKNKGKKR